MRIAITGASGLVGSALAASLRADGDVVRPLVRREAKSADEIRWDPAKGVVDTTLLEGVDGVVHLAGENIAGRWTEAKKRKIRDSRVEGTRTISAALASLSDRPSVLVSMSATGIYGPDNGDRVLDETSPPGEGFLAETGVAWEAAADAARQAGIRVVHPRLSMVLSKQGGALKAMLPAFRLGLGGVIGSGDQYWSWIALPDVVEAIKRMLRDEQFEGAVNLTSPEPVTNRTFTKALGRAVHRPTVLPVPAFGARLIFAEMADEVLLGSARVIPSVLGQQGFGFRLPDLDAALGAALNEH